jgi:acetyl esterase/lipase
MHQIFKAIEHIYAHAEEWNADTSRFVIAGESAGGFFTAMTASIATGDRYDEFGFEFSHKEHFKPVAAVCLSGAFFPDSQFSCGYPNMRTFLQAFTGLNVEELKAMFGTEKMNFYMPIVTETFPPTMIVSAKRDPLRCEGPILAEKLNAAGVPHGEFMGKGLLSIHAASSVLVKQQKRKCLKETMDFVFPYIFK